MFFKFTKMAVSISAVLTLTACGGLDQEAAPHLLASAAPVATVFTLPTAAPAEGSVEAVRVIAWEQSISLEMNRRHEEQLSLAQERQAADTADSSASL